MFCEGISAEKVTIRGARFLLHPHPFVRRYFIVRDSLYTSLPLYAKQHGYTYLVYQKDSAGVAHHDAFQPLIEHGEKVASWQGLGENMSITVNAFTEPLYKLSGGALLGPTVDIYKLHY